MEPNEETPRREKLKKIKVLSCSGGGERVVTSIVGAILLFEQIEHEFQVVVALSGSLFALGAWKGGMPAKVVARLAVEKKHIELFRKATSIVEWIWSLPFQRVYERTFPVRGLLGSEPLAKWFRSMVPRWPDGLVTAAVTALYNRRSLVLFTDRGAIEQTSEGGYEVIISRAEYEAADVKGKGSRSLVEDAVQAAVAIPGIVNAFELKTSKRAVFLWDGVFSDEGPYLKSPIVDARFLGFDEDEMLVYNVGDEEETWLTRLQDIIYKLVCKECYVPKSPAGHSENLKVIAPNIKGTAVNFWVGEYPKLWAVVKGYEAALLACNEWGFVPRDKFLRGMKFVTEARTLHRRTKWMQLLFLNKLRAGMLKQLLARYQMYDLS